MNFEKILKENGIEPTLTSTFVKSRVELLKKLHEIMMCMNAEDCYFTWILVVPDEPTEDDFKSIAEDDEEFAEVLDLFEKLFHRFKRYE